LCRGDSLSNWSTKICQKNNQSELEHPEDDQTHKRRNYMLENKEPILLVRIPRLSPVQTSLKIAVGGIPQGKQIMMFKHEDSERHDIWRDYIKRFPRIAK
jgi:hypothetical protein